MMIYFADRQLNIIGQASTNLPNGLIFQNDLKTEEIETGVSVFECDVLYDDETRLKVENYAEVGNYILREHNGEFELYSIIDTELDTKKKSLYLYAEDDGLDLLNEVFGKYEADKAYNIDYYVNMFAAESGFEIGVNEAKGTKQLTWDSEDTAAKRIADTAAQFGGCEISYTFKIEGMEVTHKYINIFKKRGADNGVQLRLNKEVDTIIATKTINNLATALQVTGGTINQDSTVLTATTSSGSPKVTYTVDLETASRTASSVKIEATIKAALTSENAEFGEEYGLNASIYIGGSWHSVNIKATDKDNKQKWSGTTSHSTEFTFTVSGITAAVTTFSDIQLKVTRSDSYGGTAGVLAATNCNKFIVPNYIVNGENGEDINSRPITIEGYKHDDGDFYVEGNLLKSRVAFDRWRRLLIKDGKRQKKGGHIVKLYTYDTFSQVELCQKAIEELKKLRETEINYKAEFTEDPGNVKIGDTVYLIDEKGELYLQTRVLQCKISVAEKTFTVVLGEHLIKESGIHQKVADLAAQFAANSQSAARALDYAKKSQKQAETAKTAAFNALISALNAQEAASDAQTTANNAAEISNAAQEAANNAQAAVEIVENSVAGMQTSIANAQAAADQAHAAAQTAETKANEAHTAATNAETKATEAETKANEAVEKANTAEETAGTAKSTAEQAISEAEAAATTAAAAKLDAENAQKDIDNLGSRLTTLSNTMQADYARKTDLTETTASLQTQITQNAAGLSSTASKVQEIDETANNAAEQAAQAQSTASAAQQQANTATANAEAAQSKANEAAQAAAAAQSEADTAKAAAQTAQSVADKAEADLLAAQADLATVKGRIDATEEDIAAAQQAVNTAQQAAEKAKEDAQAAVNKANTVQETANSAVADAANAQAAANEAAQAATLAQKAADQAKGDASAAQKTADEAKANAATAQNTANEAKNNALTAQTAANEAAAQALAAQQAANDADAKAAQAQTELDTAKQNLTTVTSRVDATAEEVQAAQQAVQTAQAAANKAKQDAEAAQSTADEAVNNAIAAAMAANNAKTAADNAQAAADEAQQAADKAQADVDKLAVRVTTAETSITQNSEKIALAATKTEVATTLGGYYTKTETDAAISIKANEITQSVSSTYATKTDVSNIKIGGRNLFPNTDFEGETKRYERLEGYTTEGGFRFAPTVQIESGVQYTISARIRGNANLVFYEINEGGNNANFWILRASLSETEYKHFSRQFTVAEGRTFQEAYICTQWGDANTLVGDWFEIEPKSLKLEKGNKATDWTPAPEDVDGAIEEGDAATRESIVEQHTSIISTCESMILSAAESLVQTSDYDTFKETVEAQLSILANDVSIKFTEATETSNSIDTDLQETKETLLKHFEFTENGLTIKSGENELKIRIDNDRIGFYKGEIDETDLNKNCLGYWNGTDFYSGNIVVELNEKAQFGNFAFVPRSDGSLSLLKVR